MKDITYNFGAIRDSIIKLSASEILKESTSKTLDKFINSVKTVPVLQKQHLIFKNIQNAIPFEKDRLAERFLNQNLQLFCNEQWNVIVQENKKIRRELLDDMHVEAKEYGQLFEAVNKLIERLTKPGFTDHENENNAYEYVMNYLTRKTTESENVSEEKNDSPRMIKEAWKFITQMAVSNFNERFKHLNEDEKKTFKILISDNHTKKNFLTALKEENITLINSKLETELSINDKNILETFKNKLEKISVNEPDKLDESIIACLELKSNLK